MRIRRWPIPEESFQRKDAESWETPMVRDWLRKPFKPEQIGQLPKAYKDGKLVRPELDFVGHAAVTDRLNKIAPDWSYTIDELFSVEGTVWLRGTMTIGGVSRPDYGDGKDPKEAIGNFIRRGAMRFGVAIDLWSREELEASAPSAQAEYVGETTDGGKSGAETVAGEAAPFSPPSENEPTSASPATTKFLNTPKSCTHKVGESWAVRIQVGGQPRCSLCGTPAVKYVEAVA